MMPPHLEESLIEQIAILISQCDSYDKGFLSASKPMSTTIRVLVHQTPKSSALLQQLQILNADFVDLADPDEPPAVDPGRHLVPGGSYCGLVRTLLTDKTVEVFAPLQQISTSTPRKHFSVWWTETVVEDMQGATFSRRDLVLDVSNKDGGAHVATKLPTKYRQFSRDNSLKWGMCIDAKGWVPITAPHVPCIRQIAHEILLTLQERASASFHVDYSPTDPVAGKDGYVLMSRPYLEVS